MPLQDNQKTRRPRLAPPPRTGAALSLAALLLAAACSQNDPRYPVYFRYAVDVKVDGVPVTIERVVKCTGTRSWNTSADPGGWSGQVYANPPVIGAKVPGSDAAVYVQTPDACRWAAEYEGHSWKNPPLKPGDLVPVLWTDNWRQLEQIEYYLTRSSLAGQDSHVEFVRIQPMTRTDKKAFKASEKRAATESPDLRPFASVKAKGVESRVTDTERTRSDRPEEPARKTMCQSALVLGRGDWGRWPELAPWVEGLPDDDRFHPIKPVFGNVAWDVYRNGGFSEAKSLITSGALLKREQTRSITNVARNLATQMRPLSFDPSGVFIDNKRKGLMSCVFEAWHPERTYFSARDKKRNTLPKNTDDKIYISDDYDHRGMSVMKKEGAIFYILLFNPFLGQPKSNEPVAMDTIN